jgi:exonuclease SbcC
VLSKIKAQNFLSWKDLNFTITKGATLVDGWNEDDQRSEGSGKSAILNSICWAIFGKLPKDANVDDVIKDGESSCSVVLEFDNGDLIVRTRKPNDLFLVKSGMTIKGKDARETQTFIEEYVGCNFETFCQSVYFAQNYDKKFLSSNQEDKGKILSSIQNLQVFDKARKEVMDLLKLETDKITKLKNQIQVEENNVSNFTSQKALVESFIEDKIKKHKQQVSMMTQQRDMLSGHVKRTQSDIQVLDQKMTEIDLGALANDETELNQAKTQYATELSDVSYQSSQIDSVKKSILSKENEGKTLANKYSNLQTKKQGLENLQSHPTYIRLLTDQKRSGEYDKTPAYARALKKKSELEAFIANPTKVCPSCGSELKNVDTSHIQKELDGVMLDLQNIATSSASDLQRIAQEILNFETQFKNDSVSIDAEMASVLEQLQVLSDFLDKNKIPSADQLAAKELELKTVIKQINDAILQTQQKKLQYGSLSSQRESVINQLNSFASQLAEYEQAIVTLGAPDVSQDQQKLKIIDQEISNVSTRLSELRSLLDTSNGHSTKLETLKEGFKEIKSYVFTNALTELNYRTNQYLNELFDMEASIKFTNEDQKIESKIVIDGHDRSLGLLSGGQNRRFNLAVDLALADIVSYRKTSKLDLLVFDEYFKDLSEISMEKSLNLLKERKCPVILIEHNSIFKNIVDNTFFVRLENGTSYESRQ